MEFKTVQVVIVIGMVLLYIIGCIASDKVVRLAGFYGAVIVGIILGVLRLERRIGKLEYEAQKEKGLQWHNR